MSSIRLGRIKKELERLRKDPPYGVSCWPKDGRLDCLEAQLKGAKETPYDGGIFKLEIRVPDRYPFEPPQVQFVTKIYHPNIDTSGRICLDVLKSPPQGSWKPSQNISTILTSIQLLLSEPNPDDGLMAEISQEYKQNRPGFLRKAKEWVDLYAKPDQPKTIEAANKAENSCSLSAVTELGQGVSDEHINVVEGSEHKVSHRSSGEGTSENAVSVSKDTQLSDRDTTIVVEDQPNTESNLRLLIDESVSSRISGGRPISSGRKGLSRKRKGPPIATEAAIPAKKSNSNL